MNEKAFTAGAIPCPTCARMFTQDQPWKKVCVSCYLDTKRRTPATVPKVCTGIEPGMLRRLIQLCHPDKNKNSEASNIATRYLLTLKGAAHE